jgi:hypothetical protein
MCDEENENNHDNNKTNINKITGMLIFFAGGMHGCWWIDNRESFIPIVAYLPDFCSVGGLMKLLCLIEIERL